MKHVLFLALVLFTLSCSGQEHNVEVIIKNMPDQEMYIMALKGDKILILDSANSKNGLMRFFVPLNQPAGILRIIQRKPSNQQRNQQSKHIDIIWNHENIELLSDFNAIFDSIQIISSEENKLYYAFRKKENEFQLKLELLHPLVIHYPINDDYQKGIITKYNQLQKERNEFIDLLCIENQTYFVSRVIKTNKSPFLDARLSEQERIEFYKKDYFEALDFSDENLLNTNIYSDKIIRYISLYRNQYLGPLDQEDEFIKAVEIILNKSNQNDNVHEFVLDYLVRGFEKFNMEKVLNYIADNYIDNSCETENKGMLQKRLESYRKMAVGKEAPKINIKNIDGKEIHLSSSENKYTLLIFWASWCPHCNELLPEIHKWYTENNPTKLEVISISLDTNRVDWESVVNKEQYEWESCSNLQSWNGKTEQDYNIYATPTMFLINPERIIVAKPITYQEFVEAAKMAL